MALFAQPLECVSGGATITGTAVDHIKELIRTVEGHGTDRDGFVRDSWIRCVLNHRLDPAVRRPAVIVEDRRLREHRESIEELMRVARTSVEALYKQVAGLGYVLLLTDSEGITVDYIGDPSTTDELRRAGLYLGADWNERRAGTNGTGTCIATGEAMTVHQGDHFDTQHIPLSCTVAPIFDMTGSLAAVLDISALTSPAEKSSQYLALELVKNFAHKIESANLIRSCSRNWIVKLTPNQSLAAVDTEYVVALDSTGVITGFNHRLRQLLARERHCDWRTPGLVIGRKFSDFFDCEIDSLTRFVSPHLVERNVIRLKASGQMLFAQVIPPRSFRVLRPETNAPAETATLPKPLRAVAGQEPRITRSLEKVARLVNTNMSILVHGETGTGKEFLAKAIHQSSGRSQGPFVPVNCAALPESLIESELFGYESGSFTGASSKGKKGLIREAHQGTLFLDEIGDMPLASQTRLLRVLAEREVTPIGSHKPTFVDMRVIAATHCDLQKLIAEGRFREDLYFRLNGATIHLPPLRERLDFGWLVDRLLHERPGADGERRTISPQALERLETFNWPGNIRELANVLDFASAIAPGPEIGVEDLPDQLAEQPPETSLLQKVSPTETVGNGIAPSSSAVGASAETRPSDKASELLAALRQRDWNISATARALGIDRTTLHRRMRRAGVALPPRM